MGKCSELHVNRLCMCFCVCVSHTARTYSVCGWANEAVGLSATALAFVFYFPSSYNSLLYLLKWWMSLPIPFFIVCAFVCACVFQPSQSHCFPREGSVCWSKLSAHLPPLTREREGGRRTDLNLWCRDIKITVWSFTVSSATFLFYLFCVYSNCNIYNDRQR